MNHVVFFSGGSASWYVAYRVKQAQGSANLHLLFTDTLIEDNDLYRFIIETAAHLFDNSTERVAELIKRAGELPLVYTDMQARKEALEALRQDTVKELPQLHWLSEQRDVWDVFHEGRFLGNSRIAPCSAQLKQRMARRYVKPTFNPEETTLYLGIDWTEEHRTKAPRKNWAPYPVEFPLVDDMTFNKIDVMKALEAEGIAPPRLYALGFAHNNCFSGDERYLTENGIKSFRETVGQKVRVLGQGGRWKDAEVKTFGKQELFKLTLRRYNEEKEILTTANHRWYVRKGRDAEVTKITDSLSAGDRLISNFAHPKSNLKLSPIGVMHGLVYGDGSKSKSDNTPAKITLCGEKAELAEWFSPYEAKEAEGIGLAINNLPRYFKEYPELSESPSYLYSWLAGYFAADGTVTGTQIKLSSSNKADLEFACDVATRLGIAFNKILEYSRFGYNDFKTPLYTVSFVASTLSEKFFLREKHRKAFGSTPHKRPAEWQVVSVDPTGVVEEVYCVVVPDGNTFTLENNIKTWNCGGFCVRAGQGHFANLLDKNRELYLYHEMRERQFIEWRDADVSILKRQRAGVVERLTLETLRTELEAKQTENIDFLDLGGCGCFVTEDDSKEETENDEN